MAYPRGGSSSTVFLVELELRSVGFVDGVKPECLEKTPRSRDENQQQTQPTYGVKSGNHDQTRSSLMGGECSHHHATPT